MQIREILVNNLRRYRKKNKITQSTLAEKCGTSTSYIGQIEIGNRFPSLDLIDKIAQVLNIKPYLLFYDDSNNQTDGVIPEKTKNEIPKLDNDDRQIIFQLVRQLSKSKRKFAIKFLEWLKSQEI
jgi:transcriptional regulator with XRE-family HTH domain